MLKSLEYLKIRFKRYRVKRKEEKLRERRKQEAWALFDRDVFQPALEKVFEKICAEALRRYQERPKASIIKGIYMDKVILFLMKKGNQANMTKHMKYNFYQMKEWFLRKYGYFDGYDQQEIGRECHTCFGSGVFTFWDYDSQNDEFVETGSATCNSCDGRGIHHWDNVALERWWFGGSMFHVPLGKLWYSWENQRYEYFGKPIETLREKIKGIVKHPGVSSVYGMICTVLLWYVLGRKEKFYRESVRGFIYKSEHPVKSFIKELWGMSKKWRKQFLMGSEIYNEIYGDV